MKDRTYIRYSEAFKRHVVQQIEDGHFRGASEASRAYRIRGATTVKAWLLKYGREDLIPKKITVMTPKEVDDRKTLSKRVRELESALAKAHMKELLSESYVEIACQYLDTDVETFKKKHATSLSDPRSAKLNR